ncbi:MAG TPA: hypothetical protein VFC63_16580 [Blastocatellia bacterium]|nr:hypothetical protein [Blastocatellia bacterium]
MQNPPPYQQYGAPPQQPTSPGPLGLQPNMFSMLCYAPCCIGLIFSIIGVAMEKSNRFIRFHSFQGLILNIVLIALNFIIGFIVGFMAVGTAVATGNSGAANLGVSLVFTILVWGVRIITLIVLIFMMIKAYGGAETELPGIGGFARKQAG